MNHLDLLEKNLRKTNRHVLKKILHASTAFLFQSIYRGIEAITAFTGLILLGFPVVVCLAIRKLFTGQKVINKEVIIGMGGQPVVVGFFNLTWRPGASLALLFSIVKGELTFIGGPIMSYEQRAGGPENNYLRSLKPGLFTLWGLRSNSKVGHEGRQETEWEYCFTKRHCTDAFIALRSIPAYLMKGADHQAPSSVEIFDVGFENITMLEAVTRIEADLASKCGTRTVFYVNADCLNKCFKDDAYRSLLKDADYLLPDGIGINIACRMIGSALKENVNGTDMLPFLCNMAKRRGYTIFLLGGLPGVAEKMAEKITKSYEVTVAGVEHGYFDHQTESERVVKLINKSGADILLVAFGAPLQERWISAHKDQLKVGAAFGVGGLFDFYSGATARAPRWLRELGLEWVYRMIQEPGRMWRRYVIGNPLFIYRMMAWRARRNSNTGE